jgi:hypothetical protein
MLEKLKEHKLLIAVIVIAGCLIFYAVGNATNFFGNPAFRMFWIISDETAHSVAIYGAIAGAVAVVAIGLTVTLIKKRKTIEQQITYNPNDNSADCHFHFGYLSERERKEKIPDECVSCKDIVKCIYSVHANESQITLFPNCSNNGLRMDKELIKDQ